MTSICLAMSDSTSLASDGCQEDISRRVNRGELEMVGNTRGGAAVTLGNGSWFSGNGGSSGRSGSSIMNST